MDFTDLRLREPFRSWYLNGLRFFFKRGPDCRSGHLSRQKEPINITSPEEKFPSPWDDLWACSNPPYLSVWTYWELGQDCGQEADQDRQSLFDNILNALGLTREEVLFWPLTSSLEGEINIQEDIFWQGVKLSGAGNIICFGERVFQGLFPNRPLNYSIFVYNDYEVVLVPGPEEMLPDNREAKKIVWRILKKTLQNQPRR